MEKVCENSLAYELRKAGLNVLQQRNVDVWYDGVVVGSYVADLLVEGELVVELKVAKTLSLSHVAQCLNYLKTTGLPLGPVVKFATPLAPFLHRLQPTARASTPNHRQCPQ